VENSTIVLWVRYFNILSTTVMAFFAIYGIIAVFLKKSSLNIFRRNQFITAFCAAALLALALEATVFNPGYYLKYFADGETQVLEISPDDSTKYLTSDGTLVENIYETKNDSTKIAAGMAFNNLNRRITSVYIEPVFDVNAEKIEIMIVMTDKNSTNTIKRTYFKGLPDGGYIPLYNCGTVSELKVVFQGKLSQAVLNKQIPFYFSGLRLFVVSCLFFAVIILISKKLRTVAAYFLFEYKFDPSNKKQNLIYVFSAAAVLLFSCICAFTSTSKVFKEYLPDRQYNQFLVDAIIGGRTYLDYGNPELLRIADRPYDLRWLEKNGFKRDIVWMSDWAYYESKHYCYFGVVPAIILYVPYKMITGNYLSNNAGIFIFVSITIILLAMLWRHCVRKYMPNINFVFYLLSFLTLFFASGLFVPLRFTRFYSIVSSAGFMFVIAGIFLLLKSVEREKLCHIKVFFACLCLALAVGCRPNLAIVSLIVPVILWRYRSLKLALVILIPYILIAIPLCYYNYIRFGSILDFGFKYNMTSLNTAAHSLLNPIGKSLGVFFAYISYLFALNHYSLFFPYAETHPVVNFELAITRFYDKGCGMINFPIVFCLFIFAKDIFSKVKPQTFILSSIFLIIAAILIFLDSLLVGFSGRYMIDFAFFIILPSIFCAWYWCGGQTCDYVNKPRLKTVYVLFTISILVGLLLFAGDISNDQSPSNAALYRYLQMSLGIPGTV